MEVKFYESVDDALLKFAVIITKSNGKWVFCKHKERNRRRNFWYSCIMQQYRNLKKTYIVK